MIKDVWDILNLSEEDGENDCSKNPHQNPRFQTFKNQLEGKKNIY
jgi:hypothetical protein